MVTSLSRTTGVKMKTNAVKNQKGMATLESVVLLIIFAVIVAYGVGFFGVIHTGIKNSIAARTLAFEIFRNRSNLSYRRDNTGETDHYKSKGYRYHMIVQEKTPTGRTWATDRKIAFVRTETDARSSNITATLPADIELSEADPVHIKTRYGICLNATCGD